MIMLHNDEKLRWIRLRRSPGAPRYAGRRKDFMLYRIYFKDKSNSQEAAEVECFDLRVTGNSRIKAFLHDSPCSVDIDFGAAMQRIADDHDRTIFDA